eukprot:6108804-Alexandrium_andersonii.AAC.1
MQTAVASWLRDSISREVLPELPSHVTHRLQWPPSGWLCEVLSAGRRCAWLRQRGLRVCVSKHLLCNGKCVAALEVVWSSSGRVIACSKGAAAPRAPTLPK